MKKTATLACFCFLAAASAISQDLGNRFVDHRDRQSPLSEREVSVTYAAVGKLSMAERRIVFRNMTPEMKTAVWIRHLGAALKQGTLTTAQRAVIQDALALLSNGFFERDTASRRAKTSILDVEIRAEFTPTEASPIFAVLGPEQASSMSDISGAIAPQSLERSRVSPNTDVQCYDACCDCARESDWCWYNYRCSQTPCDGGTVEGCGTLWAHPCDGVCIHN